MTAEPAGLACVDQEATTWHTPRKLALSFPHPCAARIAVGIVPKVSLATNLSRVARGPSSLEAPSDDRLFRPAICTSSLYKKRADEV